MDVSIVVAGLAAAGSLGAAALTFRVSSKANVANERKVDLEEHRDAIERLRRIIDEQDKHVDRVRQQLDRVQDQLGREQDVSNALRGMVRTLQDQVSELMRSRARLEEMLSLHVPHIAEAHRSQERGQERKAINE